MLHKPSQLTLPSSNLSVEAAACFLTSSASNEINKGARGFLLLNSSIIGMMRSATYILKGECSLCNLVENKHNSSQNNSNLLKMGSQAQTDKHRHNHVSSSTGMVELDPHSSVQQDRNVEDTSRLIQLGLPDSHPHQRQQPQFPVLS